MIQRKHVLSKNCAIVIQKSASGYYTTCFWGFLSTSGRFYIDDCHRFVTKCYNTRNAAWCVASELCKRLGLRKTHREDWTRREEK